MKTFFVLFISAFIIFISCKKDKFTDAPQITVKSITPSTVNQGDIITVRANYTDKQGDLDTVIVIKKYYIGSTATFTDSNTRILFSSLNVPGSTTEAELDLNYSYNKIQNGYSYLSGVTRDTMATFGFILIDKAKNRSNYSESKQIKLTKQ